jgi:hypothetical protein
MGTYWSCLKNGVVTPGGSPWSKEQFKHFCYCFLIETSECFFFFFPFIGYFDIFCVLIICFEIFFFFLLDMSLRGAEIRTSDLHFMRRNPQPIKLSFKN